VWPYPDHEGPAGTAGWAFEYRVRLALGDKFSALSGWRGERNLRSAGARRAIRAWAEAIQDDRIATPSDEDLTRECFVLAWLEELYRAGPHIGSPLLSLPEGSGRDDVLRLVREEWVEDVVTMVHRLDSSLEVYKRAPIVFQPALIGSSDVGKADPDFIAGQTLMEVKATKEDAPSRKVLCQVAAYLLLDYDDQYSIRSVGICSGRWSTIKEWDAEEYLAKLAGSVYRLDLGEVRAEFKQALRRTGGGM
jgi:hypothetical protein